MDWFRSRKISIDRFGIVSELREAGFNHYICAPVRLANGMEDAFSFATKSPEGFSAEDVALLRATVPAISANQEILVLKRMLEDVTRMYVGEEPHKRILSGDVHRGEVTRIKSAILFADMRAFTSITAEMSAEKTTALLNDFFDCIVPAIEAERGEVLKFMGDGVLAIFREENDAPKACKRALAATRTGLRSVANRNATMEPGFEIGIALHFGDVAYGNIGSGMRLDYTVVGRDVNLASRVATLCGKLDARVLVSERFRKLVGDQTFRSAGQHDLKGFSEPTPVFVLISAKS
jgi:adenylate cyclase